MVLTWDGWKDSRMPTTTYETTAEEEVNEPPPMIEQVSCCGCDYTVDVECTRYNYPADIARSVYGGMSTIGLWVCENCVEDRTAGCAGCGATVATFLNYEVSAVLSAHRILRGMPVVDNWGDLAYACEDCTYTCDHCGNYFASLEGAEGCCESERHGIEAWDYRPDFDFYRVTGVGCDPEPKTLYLGLEIEMEDAVNFAADVLDGLPGFYLKEDGSLSEDGVEMVSHPMTAEYLLGDDRLYATLDKLIQNGARAYRRDNCGIHIHMTRDAFAPTHLWRFLTFHYENPSLCQIVGQRASTTYSNWGGDWNEQRVKFIEYAKDKHRSQPGRYLAINLQNSETVELRYFKGNLKPAAIKKNVEWVSSLFEYLKPLGVKDIKTGALSGDSYLTWVRERAEEYPNLVQFLTDRDVLS